MANASINLLGLPEIVNSETLQKVTLPYAKLFILLAYLALEHKVHTRESLADLFWPELGADDARANLRRALSNIRHGFMAAGLGKEMIYADRNAVYLIKEYIWTDAWEFEKDVSPVSTVMFHKQVELYRGYFLDGISPADQDLANWVQNRRTYYEQKRVSLLERAIVLAAEAEDGDTLERVCKQLIEIDCVNEIAHSSLIRMYVEQGSLVAARKIYNSYQHALQEQLGVAPPSQFAALLDQISSQPQADGQLAISRLAVPKLPGYNSKREYRLISVLYCQLSSHVRLDQEQWLQVSMMLMPQLHALASERNGSFRQLSSSVFLIYFGYPSASEFAGKWAIEAGLRIRDMVPAELNHIGVRGAIHTDVMLTGPDYVLPDISGECSIIARNLAEFAATNTLLASEAALRGVASCFHVTSAEGAPYHAFEVQAIRKPEASDRYDYVFVGRAQELHTLNLAWEKANLSGGSSVLLIGRAGNGKSRLISQFISSSSAIQENVCWMRFLPEQMSLPLHPVLAKIRALLGIDGESVQVVGLKLASISSGAQTVDPNALRVLADLLSAKGQLSHKLSNAQCHVLFSLIVIILKKVWQSFPVTLIFEDVQWTDRLSLNFIAWLRERSEHLRLFLMITSRTHPQVCGRRGNPDFMIELAPLPPEDARTLALQSPQFSRMPSCPQQRMLDMADGIPLCIEHLLQDVTKNSVNCAEIDCPPSLRNLLMDQIDGIGELKQTLFRASCIGRKFTLQALAYLESISHHKCQQLINKMINFELLEKLPEPDQFQFRYGLVREVAYSTLTRDEQQKIQAKIAEFYSLKTENMI